MKKFGPIVLSSLFSAILAVFIYKSLEQPAKVVYRNSPVPTYANTFNDNIGTGAKQRAFISSSPTNFTDAAGLVSPSVVNIKAIETIDFTFWGNNNSHGSFTGSGVMISPEGYIVTNNHVIEEGDEYEVTLNDKRKFEAKLIGKDPATDLALLKIDGEEAFRSVNFGNSDSLRVGEWVLAVGNPFNLESTVTAGIVSAKGRNIDILKDQYSIESFIQTDAAVNPGNSGGALVNTNGELVGINTAIITRTGRYEGYSFAIPINLVQKIISDLRDFGVVQRGMLGIGIENITDKLAKELSLPNVEGIHINRIEEGGGAADAGLKVDDVIISVNGYKTSTIPELQEQVAMYSPGNKMTIEYIRAAKRKSATVILKNKMKNTDLVILDEKNYTILEDLGFECRALDEEERKRLSVEGIMVKSVYRGSRIARTNMDPGFIITKINDKKVVDLESFVSFIEETNEKIMLEGIYEHFEGDYFYAFKK